MQQDLHGQTAIVTGSSRGIGAAIARAYAAAGVHVYCAARSIGDLEDVVAEVVAADGSAEALACDVTDAVSVAAAFSSVATGGRGLDIAVLNAGIAPPADPVGDSDLADWRRTFDVNLFGVVTCAQHAIPLLRQDGGGKIVVLGSGTGHQTNRTLGAYAASKAAVASVVRTLALELRDDTIAVNELVPGPVATAMTRFPTGRTSDGDGGPVVARGTKEWVKEPDDVCDLALLLARMPNHGPSGQVFSLMGRLM